MRHRPQKVHLWFPIPGLQRSGPSQFGLLDTLPPGEGANSSKLQAPSQALMTPEQSQLGKESGLHLSVFKFQALSHACEAAAVPHGIQELSTPRTPHIQAAKTEDNGMHETQIYRHRLCPDVGCWKERGKHFYLIHSFCLRMAYLTCSNGFCSVRRLSGCKVTSHLWATRWKPPDAFCRSLLHLQYDDLTAGRAHGYISNSLTTLFFNF